MNSETKICQNCKENFTIEPDDFNFYEKLKVPAPTWCPHCRFIRKISFINERTLYKRKCDLCKASTLSIYHSENKFPVYCVRCHISDSWDARDYGRDYDFSRNFFEQFLELKETVPHRALEQNERNSGNCEYANFCFHSKDVYLAFNTTSSENIKYTRYAFHHNKDCMDSLLFKECERCYELVQCSESYGSSFLVESDQCVDSLFLFDCSNCVNCCMSSNLRNKSYVFRNQQLTREEYLQAIEKMSLGTYSGQQNAKEEFKKLVQNSIHKFAQIKNCVNAVGNFIENSKDVYKCFGLRDGENCKNVFLGVSTIKDCQDVVFVGKMENLYEFALGGRQGSNLALSISCGGGCHNMFYCDSCRSSSDCFGCYGILSKKQYCILNKQYTKEEYDKLIPKIIAQMNNNVYTDKVGRSYPFGEFFPTELSPFAYNETIAYEEEPLSKDEILKQGYVWREPEVKNYTSTIKSGDLPDDIKESQDSACDEVIECPNLGDIKTQCTSAFRILPDELSFYRQMNLPIPRYCPNCRYHARLVWKNPFRFYKRECMCDLSNHNHKKKCVNKFETMYAPDRLEKIYCKECYQQEVS